MATTLDDLITTKTRDEALADLLALGVVLGLPTSSWQPKGVVRTILVLVAQLLANFTAVLALVTRGGLLDYATAGWLTLLARSGYNVERDPAITAAGVMTLTNTSPSALDFGVGDLHFTTAAGFTYSNTAAIHVPNDGAGYPVDAAADVAGGASSASAGAISALVTPIIGLAVTNALAFLGADEESDDDLRQRCRDKLGALSFGGPAGAYAFAAKTAATSVPITRVRMAATSLTGNVLVIVATDAGPVGAADLAIADAAIQSYAPQCVTVTTVSATASALLVIADVWVAKTTTLNDAQIQAQSLAQLTAFFRRADIGGFVIAPAVTGIVQPNALLGQLFAAVPGSIVKATLTAPAADVALLATDVPILDPGSVVTVHHA